MTYRNDAFKFGPVLDGKVTRRQNVDAIVLYTGLVRQTYCVRGLVTLADTKNGKRKKTKLV